MKLNVHAIEARSYVNGPGARFVIWVQGCTLACPGCWNPQSWDMGIRSALEVDAIIDQIEEHHATLDGVTFSGGEPFLQPLPLVSIARRVQEMGLNVFIFTGFELSELTSPDQQSLLGLADWVVTGRYRSGERIFGHSLRSSSNQKIHCLTEEAFPLEGTSFEGTSFDGASVSGEASPVDGASPIDGALPPQEVRQPEIEIYIDESGQLLTTGFPDHKLRKFLKSL